MKLSEFKFKKGNEFKNKHLEIRYNTMYISEEFLRILSYSTEYENYYQPNIYFKSNLKQDKYDLELFFCRSRTYNNKFVVCGRTENKYFGVGNKSKVKINIKTKQRIFRSLIKIYLKTNLYRIDKIEEILNT